MIVEPSDGVTTQALQQAVYRVVLWRRSPDPGTGFELGYLAEEFRVLSADHVEAVIEWARDRSAQWAVYVELSTEDGHPVVARIAGTDPAQGEPFEVRAER